ncbi:uncharacterized protein LOC134691530 [Mytilus trossulus]|uniref:uncharacterized protein LOC134691530 n=1 Tax=Mytilus trossulus TaxID=6551 RepID=UPI003006E6BA
MQNRNCQGKPKANEVYVIRCENSDDWKCDQYPWIQYGLKKVTIGSAVLEKKYFKIKQPGSISQQSGKRSRPVGSLEFRRTAFYFEDKKNLVLVHYEGDENVYTPLIHGNRKEKENAPEYVRTAPSVLKAIEKVVQKGDKTAIDVYRDSISNSDIPGVQQGVMNARNVKQVENIVRKVNEQKRISKDDIYNLMLLAYHMEGYIQEITVFPDLTSIIALPEMISIVNQLLDVNTQTNGYDCGVYAIANMMEYCDKGKFNTQRRTNFIEKYMRPHLISCLEKGHFTPIPQGITSSSDFVRIYARRIDSNCQCGKPDVFENMIGCEAKRGRINCAEWVHQTCSGVLEDWYCDEHRVI